MVVNKSNSQGKEAYLKHPKYRSDIDGLRAVAVLFVVAYHAFPIYVKGGFVGVDIFFVISGFLISTIIFENLEENRFSFVEFYSRRIKRIFPALLTVLIACVVIGWSTLFADEYKQLAKHITGGAGFVSNFLFWHESGYFDSNTVFKPLLHLWSLGIEEQFYIVWPLLLWLAWKLRFNLLTTTIAVIAISFILNINGIGSDRAALFYSPLTRFWELLAGSVLAYITLYPDKNKLIFWLKQQLLALFNRVFPELIPVTSHVNTCRNISSLTGGFFLIVGLTVISKEKFFPGWWALLPVIGTVLILAAGSNAWLNRKILSNRLLVGIGLISFPLYLWHWPLLSFVRTVQSQPSTWQVRLSAVVLSIVLAWLTYRFIERPLRFGHYNRLKTVLLLTTMCAVGAGGCIIYLQNGFPLRTVVKINPGTDTGWAGGAEGHLVNECGINNAKDKKLIATCDQDDRKPHKYALLGDSKATSLYRGLMRTSTRDGRWLVIGGHGVHGSPVPVLSDNNIYKSYQKLTNIAIDSIILNKDIETVVFMTATRVLFRLNNGHSIEDLPANPNYHAALEGLSNAAEKLIVSGKKIVLIVDNPTLPDPKNCLSRTTQSELFNKIFLPETNDYCSIQLSRYLELSKQYRDLLLEVQSRDPDNIRIFDTTQSLCDVDEGVCLSHKNGRPLYSYSDHISDYAAGLIGKGLNSFLKHK